MLWQTPMRYVMPARATHCLCATLTWILPCRKRLQRPQCWRNACQQAYVCLKVVPRKPKMLANPRPTSSTVALGPTGTYSPWSAPLWNKSWSATCPKCLTNFLQRSSPTFPGMWTSPFRSGTSAIVWCVKLFKVSPQTYLVMWTLPSNKDSKLVANLYRILVEHRAALPESLPVRSRRPHPFSMPTMLSSRPLSRDRPLMM
mmetsp:Transcript_6896/g.12198  ORF Transcript_6896/g.12198 Transcript_6896/m.12198 type:complete len:201 (+) Transcript_6896:355-957(+)